MNFENNYLLENRYPFKINKVISHLTKLYTNITNLALITNIDILRENDEDIQEYNILYKSVLEDTRNSILITLVFLRLIKDTEKELLKEFKKFNTTSIDNIKDSMIERHRRLQEERSKMLQERMVMLEENQNGGKRQKNTKKNLNKYKKLK